MKKTVSLIAVSLFFFSSWAQNKYAVSAISPALLKDAHVVKRMEDIRFEINDLTDAVYTRTVALTILDEAGSRYAPMVVGYDRLRKISNFEGALYDASGNVVKKVKGRDIADYSAPSEINLYDDNRLKVHDFNWSAYPYTVEYTVEVRFNNTYGFPDFEPQSFEHLSVEKSRYAFVMPASYNLRYKAFRYNAAPVAATEKDKKVLRWEVSNLPAVTRPVASPPWHELTPTVMFAPSEFEMEGFRGSASSWADLGKFSLQLNQNRDKLPDALVQKAKEIAAATPDMREKVQRLYEFMQQHTRYISVQLGIGGLQPFEASYVAQKGYGDCKALSNYMYSLLKAVGIPSHYTVIKAGEGADDQAMMEDFPSDQFNHIVLCVPLTKDTLWLECTSQSVPAGYMGKFTGNRKALAITENGGRVVATPHYGLNENLQVRHVAATVDEEGSLSAKINTRYLAMQQDELFGMVNALSKDKVKKILNNGLDLATYDINNFAYEAKKSQLPEVDEALDLSVLNYAAVSGRRFFIVPNLMTRSVQPRYSPEDRTCDYVFSYAYRDVDTVEIRIPAGYQPEALPQGQSLKTPYGTYTTTLRVDGDRILYTRKMERFSGRFPLADGAAIEGFFSAVYKADRAKVVFVKKEDVAKPAM